MAWKCPECGSLNNNSIISCTCGYEKGMPPAPRLELLQTTSAEDTENKEIKVYKNLTPYKGGTPIEKCFSYLGFFLLIFFQYAGQWGILIFFGAYFLIIHILLGRPCPSCGVWRAGEKQMEEGSQIFLKCKYCSYKWIIEEIDTMVGGG